MRPVSEGTTRYPLMLLVAFVIAFGAYLFVYPNHRLDGIVVMVAAFGCLYLLLAADSTGRGPRLVPLLFCALALTAFTTYMDTPLVDGAEARRPTFGVPVGWITQAQPDELPGVPERAHFGTLDDDPIVAVSPLWLLFDVAVFALLLWVSGQIFSLRRNRVSATTPTSDAAPELSSTPS